MKKFIGYMIFAVMAGVFQGALIMAARHGEWQALAFEGFLALVAFAAWCID